MRSGEQWQRPLWWPSQPQGHSRVAFLPLVHLRLKCLKPKDYSDDPQTIGEHIKKRRLELGLNQAAVAKQLRVNTFTILNWEKDRSAPRTIDGGRLIAFLGYDPFPAPQSIPERLIHERRKHGWSTTQAAHHIGVHRTTWQDWERGMLILHRKHRGQIAEFLGISAEELLNLRTAKRLGIAVPPSLLASVDEVIE